MPPDPANPKGAAAAHKPPLGLLPVAAIEVASLALAHGAGKYGLYNWRQTRVPAMTYVHAALRHIHAYIDREDTDPDSLAPHLGHAIASLAILLDAARHGVLIDDRPPIKTSPRLKPVEVVPPPENPRPWSLIRLPPVEVSWGEPPSCNS